MKDALMKEIDIYWTNRADGYSKVNQEELQGNQKTDWFTQIDEKIKAHYPGKKREEIKVLDIGCGPGFFSIILAEAGYQVTAVDYTEAMIEEAKHNARDLRERIAFFQMDAQQLSFEEAAFHVVLSRNLTWVLQEPKSAYASWRKVLKEGGLLLNFDANWYHYLYDEEKKQAYEQDRKKVEETGMEDHYTCTDIDAMEEIAKKVPMSKTLRPQWDKEVLEELGMKVQSIEIDFGRKVWSEVEKINYASTPMFAIEAVK